MKNKIHNILHVNRQERHGAASLIILGILIWMLPSLYGYIFPKGKTDFSTFQADVNKFSKLVSTASKSTTEKKEVDYIEIRLYNFDPNTASIESFVELGLSERTSKSIINYRDKGGRFRKPEDFKKIYTLSDEDYERLLPFIEIEGYKSKEDAGFENRDQAVKASKVEVFEFDPNQVSKEDLVRLGLPESLSNRILNYRAKGGRFRHKEDLAKIYGFPEKDFERLERYIVIQYDSSRQSPVQAQAGSGLPKWKSRFSSPTPIDINRASIEHWQTLPAIGEKRAQMIVNYRERLGGFISIQQVSEVRGLPDSVYQTIKNLLLIEHIEVKKWNINTGSLKELSSHPYISFTQASLIVADRNQNGPFSRIEDILRIPSPIGKEWLEKVKGYLTVN